MSGLAQLREKTQNLTVLYVEDSPVLQKKMAIFLDKLFKKVYQATNGIEGLQSFQFDKPDIIISDIDMPEMDGHEMIAEIKNLDPDASIIVYSAYADSENLLKSIHLGVVDFIPKPVDIELFEKVLKKVVAHKEGATNQVKKDQEKQVQHINQDEQEEIFKQLEVIRKSHQNIEFVNHYKGIPIVDKGTISSMALNTITVEVPFLQSRAIKYEGKVVLISDLFSHTLEASLDKFNSFNNTVILKDLKFLENKENRRKVVCVEPNSDFSCEINFNNIPITASIELISAGFITVKAELEDEVKLVEGSELDLLLTIHKQTDKTHSVDIGLDLKGELYFMDKIDTKHTKIMLLLEIDKKQKEILEEYISERRKELIVEFKQIKD